MVEVVEVHKRGRLEGVSLSLREGSLALIGPNGAGKSTLLGLLAGRIRADRGEVRLYGHHPRSIRAARHRAYIPQQLAFPATLRVSEILWAAQKLKGASRQDQQEAIERMDLQTRMHQPVSLLSVGWKQRLALAAGLMGRPGLWLLDEPAAALDSDGLERLRDWIVAHLQMGGLAVLSAHRQEEIFSLASRYLHLENGRVISERFLGDSDAKRPS
jgi:ABC-type multidrug transport system ATPase subunit